MPELRDESADHIRHLLGRQVNDLAERLSTPPFLASPVAAVAPPDRCQDSARPPETGPPRRARFGEPAQAERVEAGTDARLAGGVGLQVFVFHDDDASGHLVNPVPRFSDEGEQDGPQGRLSMPGLYFDTDERRPDGVKAGPGHQERRGSEPRSPRVRR